MSEIRTSRISIAYYMYIGFIRHTHIIYVYLYYITFYIMFMYFCKINKIIKENTLKICFINTRFITQLSILDS